jgi:hypothetical protein|tara:strand:+ start:4085 stop:4306 length:222 start_codon:yes stop_codon:yes gene_type:complete
VVEAVRAWVDTYIEAEIPEGAITVAQFAATTGKSKERAQGILIGLARCGKWDRARKKATYYYWPLEPVGEGKE